MHVRGGTDYPVPSNWYHPPTFWLKYGQSSRAAQCSKREFFPGGLIAKRMSLTPLQNHRLRTLCFRKGVPAGANATFRTAYTHRSGSVIDFREMVIYCIYDVSCQSCEELMKEPLNCCCGIKSRFSSSYGKEEKVSKIIIRCGKYQILQPKLRESCQQLQYVVLKQVPRQVAIDTSARM